MKSKGINDTVFAFCTPHNVQRGGGGHFGYLVLKSDHTVYGYKHDNEHTWKFNEQNKLCFISKKNEVTSQFDYIDEHNCYIGRIKDYKESIYLLPALSCPENNTPRVREPSIFVNTVPKSGTYLLELALKKTGYRSSNIMLIGSNIVSDLRGILEADFFKNPQKTTLHIPCEVTLPIFNKNVITGHIEYENILKRMRSNNVHVVTLVRDLRNVLLSLYKFKKNVFHLNVIEKKWTTYTGNEIFKKFIEFYYDKDLEHIHNIVNTTLLDENKVLMHYENCIKGYIPHEINSKLNNWGKNLGECLSENLIKACDAKTATLTSARSNWSTEWNDTFEEYYQNSGMVKLNKLLGYDQ
jgi:hypothetical protein